jgi:hypothetical protein
LGKPPETARLPRALEAASAFPAQRRALLLREAMAFFLALVFPPLSARAWLFSSFCVRFLFRAVSLISVWVWACGAALISVKRSALVSRGASALVFSQLPLAFPILRLPALLAEWP